MAMIVRGARPDLKAPLFLLLLSALMSPAAPARAQLVLTPLGTAPPDSLVASLLGPGVSINNVQYTGSPNSAGIFSGGTGIIGFEDGIVLGTGAITLAAGPNVNSGVGLDNALPGDVDLDAIASGTTFDATVLQFDFVPSSNTVVFDYVFASDEYNEYVQLNVNDIFAFFLDGGNVALIPGTSTYVSIDTVNNCVNAPYYRNNSTSSNSSCALVVPSLGLNTEMDGLTVVLQVVANVVPGVSHHLKLAIADVGDSIFDSNVFLRAASFTSISPTPTPTATATPPPPTPTPTPELHLWPNPYSPITAMRGTLKCAVMPPGARLSVYTVSGEKVFQRAETNGWVEWDGTTPQGMPVSPGIYYYVVNLGKDVLLKGVVLFTWDP
jgi:hypothetical protein